MNLSELPLSSPDQPMDDTDHELINFISSCRKQSSDARQPRLTQNRENFSAYMNRQDFSHKVDGQSCEFMPKLAVSVEQFVSFVKKGITQFGDWYNIVNKSPNLPFSAQAAQSLLNGYLYDIDGAGTDFQTVFCDAVRSGCLESLMVFKVHGRMYSHDEISPAGTYTRPAWRLQIDLIPFEDYYPDPTGRGLYEIHRTTRDLCDVLAEADAGKYDRDVVDKILTDFTRPVDEERPEEDMGSAPIKQFQERKEIMIDEFWGTLLDSDGRVIEENVFCAVANERYVIRKPKKNPFWHGESPFVVFPLIRVPFSVFHRALYDAATKINLTMNELMNLMIDGGLASVWGISQLRVNDLYDDTQISSGIPQGTTLHVKSTLPVGGKVFEQVSTGKVPGEAMALFEALSREYASACMSNEIKMGSLPGKAVKATEVIELSQAQATLMDGVTIELENGLSRILRKAWLVLLQHLPYIPLSLMIASMGPQLALGAKQTDPRTLFAQYASGSSFTVQGVSAQLTRHRDFQRMMALIQIVSASPIMMMAFFQKYSPFAVLARLFKLIGMDPADFIRDEMELSQRDMEMQSLTYFANMTGSNPGFGGGSPAGASGSDASMQADIDSMSNIAASAKGGSE